MLSHPSFLEPVICAGSRVLGRDLRPDEPLNRNSGKFQHVPTVDFSMDGFLSFDVSEIFFVTGHQQFGLVKILMKFIQS